MTSVLSLLVPSEFDTVTKVTGLFRRRGFNIKALSVGETQEPGVSRITILTEGDPPTLEQIQRQVSKLEDVKRAALIPYQKFLDRELMLAKICPKGASEEVFLELVSEFSAKIVAEADGCYMIEATGSQEELDDFVDRLRPFGLLELSRTGVTALELSQNTLFCSRE